MTTFLQLFLHDFIRNNRTSDSGLISHVWPKVEPELNIKYTTKHMKFLNTDDREDLHSIHEK